MRFVPPIPIFVRLAAVLVLLAWAPRLCLALIPASMWQIELKSPPPLFDSAEHDLSFAIDPAGGRLLWESPFAGDVVEVDGFCAVRSSRWGIVFLDRLTGDLVARHNPGEEDGLISALRALEGRVYAFADTAVLVLEPPQR